MSAVKTNINLSVIFYFIMTRLARNTCQKDLHHVTDEFCLLNNSASFGGGGTILFRLRSPTFAIILFGNIAFYVKIELPVVYIATLDPDRRGLGASHGQ